MGKDKLDEGEDAPKLVWERAISELSDKIGKAIANDEPADLIEEQKTIKQLIVKGYHDRFGDPYSDKPDE